MPNSLFPNFGNPGAELVLTPDWFVLTDGTAAEVPSLVEAPPSPEKVKVFIDHETPCGSTSVAAEQKRLIRFAAENRCELFNGCGVSYQLMLDRFVKLGQVVAHCGDFGSIYGSVGALAVKLTPAELASAIKEGVIRWRVPETVAVQLSGSLKRSACGKDAALALLFRREAGLSGKLLLISGTEALDPADRTAFFQLLSRSGCAAALCADGADGPALTLELDTVVPMVSNAEDLCSAAPAAEAAAIEPTAVFIGGCSAGRIEDIREAARLLKGKHSCRRLRLMVAFATTEVYVQAANEGLIEALMDGGAIVMNQGCSACYAHSQGLADGRDVVLSAGSRPCPNCAGEGNAKTYLCSAATAIASAIAGHVCPAES